MQYLNECPLCSNPELELVHRPNNLQNPEARGEVPAEWGRSDYSFCSRCGLISARQRQDPGSVADFYDEFNRLERRHYVTYPLPEKYIENQTVLANGLFEASAARTKHLEEPVVLNLRSECGIVLERFRRGLATEQVYALDHFETNCRYATEDLHLPHVAVLMPGTPNIPESWPPRYDLVLANHMLTHALDLRRCMEILKALLKPGGMLLCYNEIDHAKMLLRHGVYKRGLNSFHTQLFSPKSFENLFRVCGLELVHLRSIPGIQWAVPYHSMIVIATAGAPPSGLIGDHESYRDTFKDWERRRESSRRSIVSRAKRRLKSLLQRTTPSS